MEEKGNIGSDHNSFEAQNTPYDNQRDTSNQDDETAERELDKDLQWTSRKPTGGQRTQALARPVVVPQVEPGLASLFQRAWAPDLASCDVRIEEWMQFLDHLNVCKTGTPPLQVLNLAGTVVGFVPVHYAGLAGMATNVVATGGMVAASRVRISRYLKRANMEYFVPRGLIAKIARQNTIHEVTGQPPDAPMLLETDNLAPDAASTPDIITQRMQAFQGSIALLQLDGVPAQKDEGSTLDRLTAKMNAMKASRGQKKDAQGNTITKHQAKLQESQAEAREEEEEIRRKAEKKMLKKPEDRAKIQKKMDKELAKLDEDRHSDEEKYVEKSGKGGKKVDRKLRRLLFVTVSNFDPRVDQAQ